MSDPVVSAASLERLYRGFNRRDYVHPDPLELLYAYPSVRDREVAGLVAAALAYGRVAQILRSAGAALQMLGPAPARYVAAASPARLRALARGFRHRFTADTDLARLFCDIRRILHAHGSLNRCFTRGLRPGAATVGDALAAFASEFSCCGTHLMPDPARGSACKRLNLYLRWMVRADAVDPGGWKGVSPAQLIVPLDTHMHRIARRLRMTRRASADMVTAREITDAFRRFRPDDPVRYDFVVTRFGIRSDLRREQISDHLGADQEG